MRVWIVNPFDNLPGEGYRPGRYELMARAFVAAGAEVTWWTSDFSHTRKERREVASPVGGIRLVPVPTLPYARNVSWRRLKSHAALARSWYAAARPAAVAAPPDVIIASVPPLKLADAARRLARETHAAFVADVQDLWPETFYRLLPRPLRGCGPLVFAPWRRLARRLYRGADLVTGVCDGYAATVRRAGARHYFRAYLGIEAAAAKPAARPRSADGSYRLVYLGNLGRGYDLATVIAAVRRMEGVTLDVAGAVKPHAEDRVVYHGYLGAAALAALCAGADAGVVPMCADSFVGIPNKVADYAAAGLPIVSSLAGECAELLSRTHAGVQYSPGDVESLVAAIGRVRALAGGGAAALMAELSAAGIYPEYVRRILALRTERSGL